MILNMSFTLSSKVWTDLGVNSAWLLIKDRTPSYVLPGKESVETLTFSLSLIRPRSFSLTKALSQGCAISPRVTTRDIVFSLVFLPAVQILGSIVC